MDESALIAEIRALPGQAARRMIGIAGAPASGKSTLATALVAAMPEAALLPMDGFHLDDSLLEARGHRARKGAPHTFDVAGFAAMLARVRAGEAVIAPAFDRGLEISRAGCLEISAEAEIVIVEGNYLLHDQGGWEAVGPLLDACYFLDVAEAELRRRLAARWAGRPGAAAWIESNDMPNARLVIGTRARASRVI